MKGEKMFSKKTKESINQIMELKIYLYGASYATDPLAQVFANQHSGINSDCRGVILEKYYRHSLEVNNKKLVIEMTASADQEDYSSNRDQYFRDNHIIFLVVNGKDPRSFGEYEVTFNVATGLYDYWFNWINGGSIYTKEGPLGMYVVQLYEKEINYAPDKKAEDFARRIQGDINRLELPHYPVKYFQCSLANVESVNKLFTQVAKDVLLYREKMEKSSPSKFSLSNFISSKFPKKKEAKQEIKEEEKLPLPPPVISASLPVASQTVASPSQGLADLEEFKHWRTVFPEMKQQLLALRREAQALSTGQFSQLLNELSQIQAKLKALEQHCAALDKELDRDAVAQTERAEISKDPALLAYYQTCRQLHYHFLAAKVICSGYVAKEKDLFELTVHGICTLAGGIPGLSLLMSVLEEGSLFAHKVQKHRALRLLAEWVPDTSSGDRLAERFARHMTREKMALAKNRPAAYTQHLTHSFIEKLCAGGTAAYDKAIQLKQEAFLAYRELKEGKEYSVEERLAFADTTQLLHAIFSGKIQADTSLIGPAQLEAHLQRMLSLFGITTASLYAPTFLTSVSQESQAGKVKEVEEKAPTFSTASTEALLTPTSPLCSPLSVTSLSQSSLSFAEELSRETEASAEEKPSATHDTSQPDLPDFTEELLVEKTKRQVEREAKLDHLLVEFPVQQRKLAQLERENAKLKAKLSKLATAEVESDEENLIDNGDTCQVQFHRSSMSADYKAERSRADAQLHREIASHGEALAHFRHVVLQLLEAGLITNPQEPLPDEMIRRQLLSLSTPFASSTEENTSSLPGSTFFSRGAVSSSTLWHPANPRGSSSSSTTTSGKVRAPRQ
jgi:hypothetical protein